ncbi:phosphatase PAP2 family protein [Haloferula sp. BvORR071]|uniref:phosphatase PAP2 family protein n=1 Tax=Haloferula sp. BvORR071 TaxID=1396141 RepID=UPI0009466D15|nr:phosphatase PAP2 family protein [Haloferula sp. BvORR071]
MPDRPKFLWHESAYLLLWLGLGISLLFKGIARPTDLAVLGVQAASFLALRRIRPQGPWWQVRLWLPLVALNLSYFWLGGAIPRLREWRADPVLFEIDRMLFGDCLAIRVMPAVSGALRELLSAAYLFFFPLWVGGYIFAAYRGGKTQLRYVTGFHLIFAIGFAAYTTFPAAGPFKESTLAARIGPIAHPGFFSDLNYRIVQSGCNGVDVFPSLHTAITVFVLLSAFAASRRLGSWLAIPCLLIICATIGLQYHYVADVAAGTLFGAGIWALTRSISFQNDNEISFGSDPARSRSERPRAERGEGLAAGEAPARGLPRS